MHKPFNNEFRPSEKEEWDKIEEMIREEEFEEEKIAKMQDNEELDSFKVWCMDNGILW